MATPVPYTRTLATALEEEDIIIKNSIVDNARAILNIPEDEEFTFEDAEKAVQEGRLDAPNLENVKKSIEADVAQAYDYDLQEYQEAKEEIKKDRAIVTPDGRTLAEGKRLYDNAYSNYMEKLTTVRPTDDADYRAWVDRTLK